LPYLRWQELDGFDQQLGEHWVKETMKKQG
jgi:hypothetical protein